MKPTENTFSFSINAVREQAEPPNEKVEKLESPESFDLFDKFDRGERARACGSFPAFSPAGNPHRVFFLGCCMPTVTTRGVTK